MYALPAFPRAPIFDPVALFRGGYVGGLYDANDKTTLFQDSAGTTPVAADGDPVGLWKDKSGGGNDLSQATSGARPLWHTNGTFSWLEVDGVDDTMVTGNNFTLATPWTLGMSCGFPSGADTGSTFLTLGKNLTTYFALTARQSNGNATAQIRGGSSTPAVAQTSATANSALPTNGNRFATILGEISDDFIGVRATHGLATGAVTTWDVQTTTLHRLGLGAPSATGGTTAQTSAITFRYSRVISINRRLSEREKQGLDRWLGAGAGVSIG